MKRFTGGTDGREVFSAFTAWNRVRDIDHSLGRLAGTNCSKNLVAQGVDRRHCVGVLKAYVDSRPVTRGPESVRQFAGRNRGNEFRFFGGSEYLNLVQPANGDVGELSVSVARNINVVGDGARIQDS